MSAAGAALFARYAYPPNSLGYCGPGDAEALLRYQPGESADGIAAHARQFEGAWHYLEILAAAAGIDDPLEPSVVEAYWIGNDLLDAVEPAALVEELTRRLPGQVGGSWAQASGRATAHHGFHVFEVYPWVGLLGKNSPVPLSVLDQCRIRSGVVTAIDGDRAEVCSVPLTFNEKSGLSLGQPEIQSLRWAEGGRSFTGPLNRGDEVAVHWDWVCDTLDPMRSSVLAEQTRRQVGLINAEVLHIAAS